MDHKLSVAVVILNWNGRSLLEKFIPELIAYNHPQAKIYIADNASTDDSIAFIQREYPQISIIQNDHNYGFALGYNIALKGLKEDVFAIVNSDIQVTKGWIDPILNEFEHNDDTVAAQPKLLDYKDKEYFEYAGAAGGVIDLYGYPYCRGRVFMEIEKDHGQYEHDAEIFWATGACLFIRREVFEYLGGFDGDFFAHLEEIDLCWRIHNLGKKVKYIPASKVYHVGGATLKKYDSRKTFLNFRNSLFMLVKNLPVSRLWYVIPTRLVLDGIQGVRFITEKRPKHTLALVMAHFSFYANIAKMWKKRSQTPIKTHTYYHCKSIVFSHFLGGKKHFTDI